MLLSKLAEDEETIILTEQSELKLIHRQPKQEENYGNNNKRNNEFI